MMMQKRPGLFGQRPPQQQGLLGQLQQAPMGMEAAIPTPASMTATQPQFMPTDMQRPMQAEQHHGINWGGVIADALAGAAGKEPMYLNSVLQGRDREQKAQQAEAEHQRQRDEWVYQQQWKKDNDAPPVGTSLMQNVNWLRSQGRTKEADQLIQNTTSAPPLVQHNPDGTVTVYPAGSIPRGGGSNDEYGPMVDQIPGGGVGNGPGGFPTVAGNRLDNITMQSESGGNPNAISPAGARGLMQVMPGTARDPGFGIRPSDGSQRDEARVGREYRAKMQSRYGGNLAKMWAAYNWGPGNLDAAIAKHGEGWINHAPAETRNYINRNMRQVRGN